MGKSLHIGPRPLISGTYQPGYIEEILQAFSLKILTLDNGSDKLFCNAGDKTTYAEQRLRRVNISTTSYRKPKISLEHLQNTVREII